MESTDSTRPPATAVHDPVRQYDELHVLDTTGMYPVWPDLLPGAAVWGCVIKLMNAGTANA